MLFLIPAVQESMPERSRLRLRPSTRATSTSHKSIQKFFFRPSSFSGQFFCRYTSCPPWRQRPRSPPIAWTRPYIRCLVPDASKYFRLLYLRPAWLRVRSRTVMFFFFLIIQTRMFVSATASSCFSSTCYFFFFLIIQTSDNSCRPGQSSPSALPPVVVGALRHPLSLDRAVAGAT